MADYDVFNGDADGICALIQLRLSDPREAELVTGVKRDIALLERVEAEAGDRVTVLDISMRNNRAALDRHLSAGAEIFYADHHNPGEIPTHERLTALIDTSPDICTSLIVNRHLGRAHEAWAITAAFGDGFSAIAHARAQLAGIDIDDVARLEFLGTVVNYNAYGSTIDDLHIHPAELYRQMAPHPTPMAFLDERPDLLGLLERAYDDDMAAARAAEIVDESRAGQIVMLPDAAFARRVSGVFGNMLAQENKSRAHAVMTRKTDGSYLVSVRAPVTRPAGADKLCLRFETGGGRAGAAGINLLPEADLPRFIEAFRAAF